MQMLRILIGHSLGPSFLSQAKQSMFLTGQPEYLETAPKNNTDESSLTAFSECKGTSMAASHQPNEMQHTDMDSVSEAMCILLTLATTSENHEMISSFMAEVEVTMRLHTIVAASVTSVTAGIP